MSPTTTKENHKWNDDRPVSHLDEDELSRKPFAELIAKELSAWRQKDSLVVGLNGEWGSGKSSLANFVVHCLNDLAYKEKIPAPIVVRFNPWQWSGQDKLLEGFFAEVGAAFKGDGIEDPNTASRLTKFWERLRVVTVAGGEVAQRLQESVTAMVGFLAASSGVISSHATNPWVKATLESGSLCLLFVAGICAVYAPVAEGIGNCLKEFSKNSELSLEGIRKNLRNDLAKLKTPLLIVIDDIDRLTKCEMRLLVQLVKANADFPNVVYLLLYHKTVLARALEEEAGEKGQDFLKKIVQVELQLPTVPDIKMRSFFRSQILSVLNQAEIRWGEDRWDYLFNYAVWPYFSTPRDIKRFKGMFEFYFHAHVEDGVLEVNPIDLLLIETLRMFDPEAYEAVSKAFQKQKDIFIPFAYEEKDDRDQLVLGVKELLERKHLTTSETQSLRVLLHGLFPQIKENFSWAASEENEWRRNRRVCHRDYFRRYFHLVGSPGEITLGFVSGLFREGTSSAKLEIQLKKRVEDGSISVLLEELAAIEGDIPIGRLRTLIQVLFDMSDSLPQGKSNFFLSSMENRIADVVIQLLKGIEDYQERFSVLEGAVLNSRAITAPVFCLSKLKSSKKDDIEDSFLPVKFSDIQAIIDGLLPRMWEMAKTGKIWHLNHTALIIHRLRDWSDRGVLEKWLSAAIANPEIAMKFLILMLRVTHISGGGKSREVYALSAKHLESFVDLGHLYSHVEKAANGKLEMAAVQRLSEALELRSQGKPYDSIYVLSIDSDGKHIYDTNDMM